MAVTGYVHIEIDNMLNRRMRKFGISIHKLSNAS